MFRTYIIFLYIIIITTSIHPLAVVRSGSGIKLSIKISLQGKGKLKTNLSLAISSNPSQNLLSKDRPMSKSGQWLLM